MSIKKFTQRGGVAMIAALLCLLPQFTNAVPTLHQAGNESTITFKKQTLEKGRTFTSTDFSLNVNGSQEDNDDNEPIWWGYFSEGDASKLSYSGYLGYSKATTIDAAICIPAGHPIAGEGKVKAVRFWLGSSISAINSDVTIWISNSLPNKLTEVTYSQVIPRSSLTGRLNEIELTTPYDINNNECYIGYSFSISSPSYPIMGYGQDHENAWFYRVTGSSWEDFYGEGYGNLALQVLLEGVNLKNNSVTPSDFGTNYALLNSEASVPVTITNFGKEAVSSISYTITTNGNVSEEKTCNLNNLSFNSTTTVHLPFPADKDAKKQEKTLTITKVNGVANEADVISSEGILITITEKPTPTPVVEEFTGTWCGWCTVGYDGMEKTKEIFGDKAVLIAVHNGDPMEISDYNAIANRATGYPSSIINRATELYPSAYYLTNYINNCLNDITIGEIKATASWADEEMTIIQMDTETKFVYSDDNGKYGIAFVLIEDGMTGTASGWAQTNYLSGNSDYADSYPFWYNAASKVTGLEFNHVAVAAWNIEYGINGSVNPVIHAGDIQTFTYYADITSKRIIQDRTNLKVAALLIDKTNGIIINASETPVQEYNPTAIIPTKTADAQESERYTLDGRKVTSAHPGLNIIRMSDGSVRKVVVR